MKAHCPKLTALAVSALTLGSLSHAQTEPYEQALRELNIMGNIFAATLREDGDSRAGFAAAAAPRSLYLAGQGMVFTFDINNPWLRGFGGSWQTFSSNMSQLANEAAAEVMAAFPELDFDFDFDFDYQDGLPPPPAPAPPVVFGPNSDRIFQVQGNLGDLAEAMEDQREAMREMAEASREMAEAMRDRQRDIQDLQRDLRDVQRDLRDQDADSAALQEEMSAVEAELETERAALEQQRTAYQEFVTEYEAARQEQITTYSRELVNTVVSTLCDYGATLRSLENGEHVTLIFENFSSENDQIHIFDYSAVSACTSAEALLGSAVSYQI